jgi:hypothetical protein
MEPLCDGPSRHALPREAVVDELGHRQNSVLLQRERHDCRIDSVRVEKVNRRLTFSTRAS